MIASRRTVSRLRNDDFELRQASNDSAARQELKEKVDTRRQHATPSLAANWVNHFESLQAEGGVDAHDAVLAALRDVVIREGTEVLAVAEAVTQVKTFLDQAQEAITLFWKRAAPHV